MIKDGCVTKYGSLKDQSVLPACGQSVVEQKSVVSWLHILFIFLITRIHFLNPESPQQLPGAQCPLCFNAQISLSARRLGRLVSSLFIQ